MPDVVTDYASIFDADTETPEFKLELLSLRLSHMIFQAMEARGMNRTDLANTLEVSAPMVTKILSGRSNFTLKTLVYVADALDYEFEPVLRPKDYSVAMEYTSMSDVTDRMMAPVGQVASFKKTSVVRPAGTGVSGDLKWGFSVSDLVDGLSELQAA